MSSVSCTIGFEFKRAAMGEERIVWRAFAPNDQDPMPLNDEADVVFNIVAIPVPAISGTGGLQVLVVLFLLSSRAEIIRENLKTYQ